MTQMRMKAVGREEWLTFDLTLGRDGAFTWEDGALALHGRVVSSALASGEAEGWLDCDGRITPFVAVRVKERVHVWAGGVTTWIELAGEQRSGARQAAPAGDEITAPMPGTILKVNVAVGADVEAHQPLLVMESMKMELALQAPRAGRVEGIFVKEGDLVEMGAPLARLEKASS